MPRKSKEILESIEYKRKDIKWNQTCIFMDTFMSYLNAAAVGAQIANINARAKNIKEILLYAGGAVIFGIASYVFYRRSQTDRNDLRINKQILNNLEEQIKCQQI